MKKVLKREARKENPSICQHVFDREMGQRYFIPNRRSELGGQGGPGPSQILEIT